MSQDQATRWKNEALDAVFVALAASRTLVGRLVFKGARILNRRLGSNDRQSLDIDSNLTQAFLYELPDRAAQRDALQTEIRVALERHFAEQDIVRYDVTSVAVQLKPKSDHPQGWNAFEVRIGLSDNAHPGVRGLPALVLDIAAPEALGPQATAPLNVDGYEVTAYTLERIAGEKLRAFLSSLPAYREKLRRPGDSVRAKDVYDIARIERARPLDDSETEAFWVEAADEFRRACESRYVDCPGPEAFEEALETTRAVYERDATLPQDDIPFDAAWGVLGRVVQRLLERGIIPFAFPIPTGESLEIPAASP